MNHINIAARLVASLLILYASIASAEQTITFSVPVKLSNLYSDVKSFSVGCNLRNTANPAASYAHGRMDISINKSYSGTIAVPVKVPDSVASQVNAWTCEIFLFYSSSGMGCTPAVGAAANACKVKAGTQLVTKVQGTL